MPGASCLAALANSRSGAPTAMDPRTFERLLREHYASLYHFAYSLAQPPADAADLTQQASAVFAQKGGGIRDASKQAFTTLYRDFLRQAGQARRIVSLGDETKPPHEFPASPPELERRQSRITSSQCVATKAPCGDYFNGFSNRSLRYPAPDRRPIRANARGNRASSRRSRS